MARKKRKRPVNPMLRRAPLGDDERSGYEPLGFPALVAADRRQTERIAARFPRGGNPYDLSGTSDD